MKQRIQSLDEFTNENSLNKTSNINIGLNENLTLSELLDVKKEFENSIKRSTSEIKKSETEYKELDTMEKEEISEIIKEIKDKYEKRRNELQRRIQYEKDISKDWEETISRIEDKIKKLK